MARVTRRAPYNVHCSYSAKRKTVSLWSKNVRKDASWACVWKLIT